MKPWFLLIIMAIIRPTNVAATPVQTVSNPWLTVDAGGGNSRGGAYSLSGTIGQWDATSALSGGPFILQPGFWSGLNIVPSPVKPVLRIRFIGNRQAILSWPATVGGFRLEECDQLGTQPWVPTLEKIVEMGGEHTVTVPATAAFRCYRLAK
jgi:hypothetical protein